MYKKIVACLLIALLAAAFLPGCKSNREHDHVYGAWEITEAPSCTASGKKTRSCVVCGEKETRDADPLPHDFNTDNICKRCAFELKYNDGLEYTLSADGNSYILSGRGENALTQVVVPFYHDGKPVTEIAEDCFLGSAVTSFQIQNSIKKIGARAFNSCDALESFYMYDSVEEVGNFAFASCTALKSVRLSENLTVLDELFYGCTSLFEAELGSRIIEIKDLSFFGCTALTAIDLPAGLQRLGTMAFSESGILSVGIPSGVTALERGLFLKCPALKRVTLTGNVTQIAGDQFENCPTIEKLIFTSVAKDDWKKMDCAVFWEGENCGNFSLLFKDGKLSLDEAKGDR